MIELEIIGDLTGKKDKNYWLCAWRLKNNIKEIQNFASLIVTGKIIKDNNSCAIIGGMRWYK